MFTTEDCTSLSSLHESVQCNEMFIDSIQFTSENVFKELSNLQHDKPCGPDNLLFQLLTVKAEFISLPISHLLQWSLSSGTLPRDWVTANIVPVHKKDDKYLPSKYHPYFNCCESYGKNYSSSTCMCFRIYINILLVIPNMAFAINAHLSFFYFSN